MVIIAVLNIKSKNTGENTDEVKAWIDFGTHELNHLGIKSINGTTLID